MLTTHTTFSLAGHTVHHVIFDPTTFTDADLLWLPHHAQLTDAGRKRKTDHLAGRIAAAHALNAINARTVPGIGPSGEPLWPEGVSGSISHSGTCAMAVVTRHPHALVGIDCEAILPGHDAQAIKEGIIDAQEETVLIRSGFPFAVALTLAFSAKESVFKALFPGVMEFMGFDCARVTTLAEARLTLTLTRTLGGYSAGTHFTVYWLREGSQVITLLSRSPAVLRSR